MWLTPDTVFINDRVPLPRGGGGGGAMVVCEDQLTMHGDTRAVCSTGPLLVILICLMPPLYYTRPTYAIDLSIRSIDYMFLTVDAHHLEIHSFNVIKYCICDAWKSS